MKDNSIKDNSVGIQAGNNLTINQTVNELPVTLQNMLIELLKPSIEEIGKSLQNEISTDVSKSIGNQIKSALEESFVKSIKEQIRSQNINSHLEIVINKIHSDGENNQRPRERIHETLEKTDLFIEWVESAENISPDKIVISKIWENWLYQLSQSSDTSNQKILLDCMKQLTPDDADILLGYRRRKYKAIRQLLFGNNLKSSGKTKYITNKLYNIGLLQRSYYLELLAFIFSFVIIFILNDASTIVDNVRIFLDPTKIVKDNIYNFGEPITYIGSFVFPLLIYFTKPYYYLTWLGSEIVSFAHPQSYSLTKNALTRVIAEGVPKEIVENLLPLRHRIYHSKEEFVEAILECINSDQFEEYREVIFKYGRDLDS